MWRLVARQRMHPATFSVAIAQDPLQHPGLKTMNEDAEEAHAALAQLWSQYGSENTVREDMAGLV
jgi:hypothetical protein